MTRSGLQGQGRGKFRGRLAPRGPGLRSQASQPRARRDLSPGWIWCSRHVALQSHSRRVPAPPGPRGAAQGGDRESRATQHRPLWSRPSSQGRTLAPATFFQVCAVRDVHGQGKMVSQVSRIFSLSDWLDSTRGLYAKFLEARTRRGRDGTATRWLVGNHERPRLQ